MFVMSYFVLHAKIYNQYFLLQVKKIDGVRYCQHGEIECFGNTVQVRVITNFYSPYYQVLNNDNLMNNINFK